MTKLARLGDRLSLILALMAVPFGAPTLLLVGLTGYAWLLAAATAMAALPPAADAGPIPGAVDWGALAVDLCVPVALAVLAWIARHAADWFHLRSDSMVRAYLEQAAQSALSLAYREARVRPGETLTDAQISAVTAAASSYLRQRVPDAIRRFDLDAGLGAFLAARIAARTPWGPDTSFGPVRREDAGTP